MRIISVVQGSKEWHEHRAKSFNASDAPAMLGISKYKTRSDLLKERATGIAPEIDDATQRIFNDGHRFEALARPIAEGIIGDDLSPVTGVDGEYSASFDGITFDRSAIFEHKSLNADIRTAMGVNGNTGGLAEMYRVQMEQQLMISGAEKCLFMASKFDHADCLVEEVHGWYLPDLVLRKKIIAGWEQFAKDLGTYVPQVEEVKAVADAVIALPSLAVQIKGEVTASNLPVFVSAADMFLAGIKTELVTDQDFANAEANVKACKAAEDGIEQTKKAITAQAVSIDEVMRTMDLYKEKLANVRLKLDKLVKSEKGNRKLAIISEAKARYAEYITALESEIKPISMLKVQSEFPDFAGAMKGLKKLSAMQEAVDTVLRNEVFAADQVAKDVREKLAWCKDNAAGHSALFPDLQQLVAKPMDDFTLLITSRIDKHKAEEAEKAAALIAKIDAENAAKLEAEREAIRIQEEAKARAKVEAEQLAAGLAAKHEAERIEGLQKAIDAAAQREHEKSLAGEPSVIQPVKDIFAPENKQSASVVGLGTTRVYKPESREIVRAIEKNFGVSYGTACDWLLETAESLRVAA